ncbi:hypothetical protein IGI04_001307, partial [Brassica rapa subsp. trilocularis]
GLLPLEVQTLSQQSKETEARYQKSKDCNKKSQRLASVKSFIQIIAFLPTIGCRIQAVISHYFFFFVKQSSIVYDKKIVKIFWHHCSRKRGHKEIVWHNSWGLNTRLPYICTMPLKMDEGWKQIQLNLPDLTRRAYGTNYAEKLRVQEFAIKAENTIIEMYLRLHTERIFYWPMTRLAPSKVFLSSIATVIRPTPPGTGVMNPATLEASEKSTSPTNRYPDFI